MKAEPLLIDNVKEEKRPAIFAGLKIIDTDTTWGCKTPSRSGSVCASQTRTRFLLPTPGPAERVNEEPEVEQHG